MYDDIFAIVESTEVNLIYMNLLYLRIVLTAFKPDPVSMLHLHRGYKPDPLSWSHLHRDYKPGPRLLLELRIVSGPVS